ncbi:MAG: response regulator [Solirubrobacterales bacterium]
MIRVLIAEDQTMVRGALAALLELEEDLAIVAQVARADEVLDAARRERPDVALLDIEMPGGDGLEAAQTLACELPAIRSLVLTTFARPGYLRRAMAAGAAGSSSRRRRPRSSRWRSGGWRRASGSSTPAWPPRR